MVGKSVRNCVIGFLLEANNALPRKPEIERVDMFPITSSLGDGPFRGVVSLPTPCSIIPYPSLKLFQHLLDFTRYLFHFTIYEPYFSDCFAYYIRLIGKLWFCVVVLFMKYCILKTLLTTFTFTLLAKTRVDDEHMTEDICYLKNS